MTFRARRAASHRPPHHDIAASAFPGLPDPHLSDTEPGRAYAYLSPSIFVTAVSVHFLDCLICDAVHRHDWVSTGQGSIRQGGSAVLTRLLEKNALAMGANQIGGSPRVFLSLLLLSLGLLFYRFLYSLSLFLKLPCLAHGRSGYASCNCTLG